MKVDFFAPREKLPNVDGTGIIKMEKVKVLSQWKEIREILGMQPLYGIQLIWLPGSNEGQPSRTDLEQSD